MATVVNRPAARRSTHAYGAGVALGVFGVAGAVVVLARVLSTWHVSSSAGARTVTLLGQRLAYPAANADAVVVLAMALPALCALGLLVFGAVREAIVASRLSKALKRNRIDSDSASLGDAFVIAGDRPLAFCAGLIRARIYISAGAVELLDPAALAVVLEHERHHARRRDPLRLAVGRVLSDALFFVPGLTAVIQEHAVLTELGADEAALHRMPGNRPALARAILAFAGAPGAAGIETERIDKLLEPGGADWRFPAALCAGSAAVVTLLIGIAVVAGRAAAGSATLALPLLSREPCVLTLAGLTASLLVAAGATRRRRAIRTAGSDRRSADPR
jgi:hypothetical protein